MILGNIRKGGELYVCRHPVYKGGLKLTSVWEDLTMAVAADTSTTAVFPALSLPFGVNVLVVSEMTTAATFSVGISGDTTCFLNGVADTADATYHGFYDDAMAPVSADTAVLVTPNAEPGADDGVLRIQLIYWEMQDVS